LLASRVILCCANECSATAKAKAQRQRILSHMRA
jgi:hypothetical protein